LDRRLSRRRIPAERRRVQGRAGGKVGGREGAGNGSGDAAPEAMAFAMVVRTCAIDRLILMAIEKGIDTVINLGAGLDTRPYRMQLRQDCNG